MGRKVKNPDAIIQMKLKQKKYPDLKKYFASYFNPDHTKLKVPTEVEYIHQYTSKSITKSISKYKNNEPSDEEVKKAMKNRIIKASPNIEAEFFKIAYLLP